METSAPVGAVVARPGAATAEAAPDSVESQAATTFRAWLHKLFLDLATGTDTADPRQLAETPVLLYDGAVATAQMDKTPQAARTVRRTAEVILDNVRHRSVEADAQAL